MNLFDLILAPEQSISLEHMQLEAEQKEAIELLLKEQKYTEELTQFGLEVNNKILFTGPSGLGKTMTAKAIAHALSRPLLILNLSNLVSPRIGETAQNLKQIFDKASRDKAILFLDEFDHIGKARSLEDKEVGEMRRLVNSLIQLIDYFPNKAILIAATNHPEVVDTAILRRFQVHISFHMPAKEQLDGYYEQLLEKFPRDLTQIDRQYDISYAKAKDLCLTQVKKNLISKLESEA